MPTLKLLSFFIRGKPVQRWYDFRIHRFVRAPEKMYRLSLSLNYVPIHGPGKYRSYLWQFWTLDREEIDRRWKEFLTDFILKVGRNLESTAYAEEEVMAGFGYGIQEVEFNPNLDRRAEFEVEYH
jgi:hypothetical protein